MRPREKGVRHCSSACSVACSLASGVCCVISPVVHGLISRKKKAALKSGVECEGSLTAASVDTAQSEEGEVKAYYLEYEFHVPASSSTHPG
jgi:hypothetical protein